VNRDIVRPSVTGTWTNEQLAAPDRRIRAVATVALIGARSGGDRRRSRPVDGAGSRSFLCAEGDGNHDCGRRRWFVWTIDNGSRHPAPGRYAPGPARAHPDDTVWRRIFAYQFTDTDVAGHSMGNLILATLTDLLGDFEKALLASGYLLGARGRIVPVASQSLQLSARIDHEIVNGQVAVAQHRGEVQELILEPNVTANPVATEAISQADQIVFGPGSVHVCSFMFGGGRHVRSD
jgi:hypothetical protein